MPKKHPRGEADISRLAGELAGRWQPGDGIEPWLQSVEPELSRKVRSERWSWESIARTLNVAGILYHTGRPWTGTSLLRKITSVRYESRRQVSRRDDALPGAPVAQPVPVVVPVATPATEAHARPVAATTRRKAPVDPFDEAGGGAAEKPRFEFVTLKDGELPLKPPPAPSTPPREQPTATKASDEEILRRVFGNNFKL